MKNNSEVKVSFKGNNQSGRTLVSCIISFGYRFQVINESKEIGIDKKGKPILTSVMVDASGLKQDERFMQGNARIYKQVKVSTGLSVPIGFYENGKCDIQTGIFTNFKGQFKNLNTNLFEFKENVLMLMNSLPKDSFTPEKVKEHIKKHLVKTGGKAKKQFNISSDKKPFHLFIKDMIKEEEAEILKTKITGIKSDKFRIKEQSLNQHISFANQFEKYNPNISTGEINADIVNDFFKWLRETPMISKRTKKVKYYTDETIDGKKKSFKKYLRFAISRKVSSIKFEDILEIYSLKRWKSETKEIVYLSISELDKLQAHPLTGKEKVVRDLFIVASWSGGKRFSDYKNLSVIINGNGLKYITNTSLKTNVFTKVPLFNRVEEIYNSYGKRFPSAPANFNDILRKVVKDAGIEKDVTSHCARRSFCSNMMFEKKYDLNPYQIMVYSGHKSISQFQKYVAWNENAMAEKFAETLMKINE